MKYWAIAHVKNFNDISSLPIISGHKKTIVCLSSLYVVTFFVLFDGLLLPLNFGINFSRFRRTIVDISKKPLCNRYIVKLFRRLLKWLTKFHHNYFQFSIFGLTMIYEPILSLYECMQFLGFMQSWKLNLSSGYH